ncbi:hypothetical protein [Rhodococcus sp. NJ-530]|uniref:hypothetical protein n=1 Tax=Rhodococcus sp. NJ-530 TaxID=2490853 RepID=UPI001F14A465|nr:hypothetical protein [Rhodococcus sp. NJ-530]
MVYQRWLEVLGHHARYPSTRMLADALDAVGGTGIGGYDGTSIRPIDSRCRLRSTGGVTPR